ncbi:MAG: hypothetical protein AAFR26_18570 [Cyanobacteria bacterium J06626_4]
MLFAYTYVPHQMEKMQEFIDFIFFEVWCKAPDGEPFSLDLFDGHAELKEVMEAFHYSDTKGADFFNSHVESIYGLFATLTSDQIDKFRQWYQANNEIEKVCANDQTVHVVTYSDIETTHLSLGEQLKSFFEKLYSFNPKALREKIGQIDDHYHDFVAVNNKGKCPFCGIGDIKGIHHSKREAYDHYLPKSRYPFNSINFRNLAPACHECNSTYKLSKDPVQTAAGRRKAFYPYASTSQQLEISIDFSNPDVDNLTASDVQLTFGPSIISEELDAWKDVYGIEERYKAKCCSGDAKDWLEQVRILRDEHGVEPTDALASWRKQSEKDLTANSNFLRVAFLEGCHRLGLWSSHSPA